MKRIIVKTTIMLMVCTILVLPVLSSNGTTKIDVTYGIQVAVDGYTHNLTDANGDAVYPFVYKGTTYVPLRSVSQLLGASVWYDSENVVAHILSPDTSTQRTGMSEPFVELLEIMLLVEECVDEYNYIDYNISTALYKYMLDTKSGLDYLDDLHSTLDDAEYGIVSDISFWIVTNYLEHREISADLISLKSDLRSAFSDLKSALDNLENFFDCDYSNSLSDFYFESFQNDLSSARTYISNVETICDIFIDSAINVMYSPPN